MRRASLGLIGLGLLLAASPGRAQGGLEGWTGTWVAVGRDTEIVFWADLEVRSGHLTGGVQDGDERAAIMLAIEQATVEGDRVTLTVEPPWDDAPRGRVVLVRSGGSLRVVEAVLEGRDPIRGVTLARRDRMWRRTRPELLDMGQGDYDVSELRRFVALDDAVRSGIADAGRAEALNDDAQAECAFELVLDARQNGLTAARARAVAAAWARVGSSPSLCGVPLDDVRPEGLDRPGAPCFVARVEDADGQTMRRAGPSSRSDARGTLENGQTVRVLERRGHWLRVSHTPEAWIYDGNTRCLR